MKNKIIVSGCPRVCIDNYSWSLNNVGVRGTDPLAVENPGIISDSTGGSSYLWIQPTCWECENTVFDLHLEETKDVKPMDTKGRLYLLGGKAMNKWSRAVQTHVVVVQLQSTLK